MTIQVQVLTMVQRDAAPTEKDGAQQPAHGFQILKDVEDFKPELHKLAELIINVRIIMQEHDAYPSAQQVRKPVSGREG
jgi:hypothetical protein